MKNILHESAPVCAQNNGHFHASENPQNAQKNGLHLGIHANISAAHEWRGLQPLEAKPQSGARCAKAHQPEPLFSPKVDTETGEILDDLKPVYDPYLDKIERFRLQSSARRLLPHFRISHCLRALVHNARFVKIMKSKSRDSVFYTGLQTCGSQTACPVCGSRISEVKRGHVKKAMDAWNNQGGDVLMLTLTIPHKNGDCLPTILKAQATAMSRFNGDRPSRRFFDDIGCIGSIRSFEITHGSNGFHPHFHVLLFVSTGLDLSDLEDEFYFLWANSCRLAKLPQPSRDHGVKLHDGTKAHGYVTKSGNWGMDSELTKSNLKKSKKTKTSRSPFDLLNDYSKGCKDSGELFRACMEALKGKNMLVWSKGLKAMFDIEEITDQEIVNTHDEDAFVLASLNPDDWKLVLKHDLRGELLKIAKLGGLDAVRRVLDSLRAQS